MSCHGIKTYESNHKLPYMDSSIQLTSDEVRRIVIPKQHNLEHTPTRYK
jgi:hypothetical protein